MPETCENWLDPVNSCIYYAYQTCEIYELLPYSVDFKAPGELWNPLSKTVLSKCSFIWNKGLANIGNNHKAQNNLVRRTYKYLSWFFTFHNSTSWVNYEVSFVSILEENDHGLRRFDGNSVNVSNTYTGYMYLDYPELALLQDLQFTVTVITILGWFYSWLASCALYIYVCTYK